MANTAQPDVDVSALSETGKALIDLKERIIGTWLCRVRSEIGPARHLSEPVLVDTLPSLIENIAKMFNVENGRTPAVLKMMEPWAHGQERARMTDFEPMELIREYQILRQVILSELKDDRTKIKKNEKRVIHDAIDQAMRDGMAAYAAVQTAIREQFIASLSHDLRNPLTAAKTAMELVVRRPHADNVAQLAGRAIEGLERVDRMIEDLLDLTAVRAGRPLPLRLKKFDARTLVARVCSRLSVSHNKPIELDLTSVEVHWDHEKIERVIENLLGNALKHGDLARPIRVHMDSNYERVRVSVHNFGAVIPPAEHKRIFQPYHRIGAEQGHTHGGWGLGLPLVEGVTHAHGGSVTVESTPETGTLFTLDLPLDVRPLIEERSRF